MHFANVAEESGIDAIVIVSELDGTTRYEKDYRELISRVRSVYHGQISMAFDTEEAIYIVQFWDVLDWIGTHPYFLEIKSLSDPSPEQLAQAYAPYMDRLEKFAQKYDKKWNYYYAFVDKPAEDVVRSLYGAAPRPTSTPIPTPGANDVRELIIYKDAFGAMWSYYPPDQVNSQQTDIAISGNAIRLGQLT